MNREREGMDRVREGKERGKERLANEIRNSAD